MNESKLLKAEQFMQEAHRGQTRWDGRPFQVHPVKVVEILESMGFGVIPMLCAGYLHDTIEDTNVTKQMIENEFGSEVADYVDELTFKEGSDEKYWLQCSELSRSAKVIKIADIIANLGDNHRGYLSNHFIQKRTKALEILLRDTLK